MAEKKEHKIVSASTGEEVKAPKKAAPKAAAPKATPKATPKAVPAEPVDKAAAKGKRIAAVIFWVFAIVFEVLALLVYIGKVDLGFMSQLAQLIVFLVIDFILVVVGAQFWKKANHMDPISEEKSFKFWLWNNMGVIVCCFAFIPFLIYVLFIDKNADPKMKKIASIVAAVALLFGVGLSYDYNPVSEEGLAQAQQTLAGQDVYWTQFGTVYHTDEDCQHLNRSSELTYGSVDEAIAAGKTRLCKTCAKNNSIEIDNNGAIVSVKDAVEDLAVDVTEEPAA